MVSSNSPQWDPIRKGGKELRCELQSLAVSCQLDLLRVYVHLLPSSFYYDWFPIVMHTNNTESLMIIHNYISRLECISFPSYWWPESFPVRLDGTVVPPAITNASLTWVLSRPREIRFFFVMNPNVCSDPVSCVIFHDVHHFLVILPNRSVLPALGNMGYVSKFLSSMDLPFRDTIDRMWIKMSGIEYQQGELQGYEIREYLLEKFHRTCVYCGKTGVPLEIEHLTPRSRDGPDTVNNLAISCHDCNQKKNNLTAEEFGYPEVRKMSCLGGFAWNQWFSIIV